MQNEFSAARFGRMRGANDTADRIRGCLFGGAVGDALGYPAEFLSEKTESPLIPFRPRVLRSFRTIRR